MQPGRAGGRRATDRPPRDIAEEWVGSNHSKYHGWLATVVPLEGKVPDFAAPVAGMQERK